MEVGDKIIYRLCGEAGEIIYSAVIKENVPCGDGILGSWGVAKVNPTIWRTGMLTEHRKSWFNGLFYDYWIILGDDGKLVKLNDKYTLKT